MTMLTRPELSEVRRTLAETPEKVLGDRVLLDRLLVQAEYALDCAALVEEAVHYPAEPYGEAQALVARLTDAANAIWNRFHYR